MSSVTSGPILMSAIALEYGGYHGSSRGNNIGAYRNTKRWEGSNGEPATNFPSTNIKFSDVYGKMYKRETSLTISSNWTTDYNIFTSAGSPTDNVSLSLTVSANVVATSSSTYAIDTTSSFTNLSDILITVNSSRYVVGSGGNGGRGSDSEGVAAAPGTDGGNALRILRKTKIVNNGIIGGGGGGGGGGGNRRVSHAAGSGGGGAGGSTISGKGGTGGPAIGEVFSSLAASNGTISSGGAGALAAESFTDPIAENTKPRKGGDGGNLGQSGQSGSGSLDPGSGGPKVGGNSGRAILITTSSNLKPDSTLGTIRGGLGISQNNSTNYRLAFADGTTGSINTTAILTADDSSHTIWGVDKSSGSGITLEQNQSPAGSGHVRVVSFTSSDSTAIVKNETFIFTANNSSGNTLQIPVYVTHAYAPQ